MTVGCVRCGPSAIGLLIALSAALSVATSSPARAETVVFNCTGQMRVVKQYKDSDLGDRDTFPFTETLIVDFSARTARIGIATFPKVTITDDLVEGRFGTFELGEKSDLFSLNLKSGEYHHMTREPMGRYDIFSEDTRAGTVCKKSQEPEK
jgi:hypothetical protein